LCREKSLIFTFPFRKGIFLPGSVLPEAPVSSDFQGFIKQILSGSMASEITISTEVQIPVGKAWNIWVDPLHIIFWNFALHEWHCPRAENDLRPGGKFSFRMEAKDESMGFDFGGTHDEVELHRRIASTLDDGRHMEVTFRDFGGKTLVTETFEAEETNPVDMQKKGWQSILENYRKYAEGSL
jgi:uncharacterized protein YndB with AHSA1/START domain